MNLDSSPSGGPTPPGRAPRPVTRAGEPTAPDFASVLRVEPIPISPPPDAMAEVERAAERYDELRADRYHLHFELAERRVRVEVQDLDGTVLRRIPSASALDIAAGGPV
jgi:hypothetical protein